MKSLMEGIKTLNLQQLSFLLYLIPIAAGAIIAIVYEKATTTRREL